MKVIHAPTFFFQEGKDLKMQEFVLLKQVGFKGLTGKARNFVPK
jgi:hypothetical protein